MNPSELPDDDFDPVAPECRATVGAIQLVLDGALSAEALETDPHTAVCATCRERGRAARVLLSALALPPAPVPADFTEKVMADVWGGWRARQRHRVYKIGAVLALAAAVLIAAFVIFAPAQNREPVVPLAPVETAKQPETAPAPHEKTPPTAPTPEPRPMRISDEVAKAGQAFRDAPKPLTDSVAVAPKLYEAFSAAFTKPAEPVAPMGEGLEPARKSLAELPDAARHGLEPVTGTAQKAYARLLRDVAAVKPKS